MTYGVAVLIISALTYFFTSWKVVVIAFSMLLGLMAAMPQMVALKSNLYQFVSSRNVTYCIASQGFGYKGFFKEGLQLLHVSPPVLLIPFGVLVLLVIVGWRRRYLFFSVLSIMFLSLVMFGWPRFLCLIDGFSGVRFSRHFIPYVNVSLLIFVLVFLNDFWTKSSNKPLRRLHLPRVFNFSKKTIYRTLVLFLIVPFWHFKFFNLQLLFQEKDLGKYDKIPKTSAFFNVQMLSQSEDRRHFSPYQILVPNYSTIFKILDVRVLYALYPKTFFKLNSSLTDRWARDPVHHLKPDRFYAPVKPEDFLTDGFQRLAIMNRVSLLSFKKGKALFYNKGPYSEDKCQKVSEDEYIESYLCPLGGRVGYFPKKVEFVTSDDMALEKIKKKSLEELPHYAFIEDTLGEKRVGEGEGFDVSDINEVISFKRYPNTLTYQVSIKKPAWFVIADTFFDGWKAQIDGAPTKVYKANVAFKSVYFPQRGRHVLKLHFQVQSDLKKLFEKTKK
ncbi:MAG: hypothetical protein D6797_07480 [Bdellovibrio sp.]|nr:MAG: hypothetical protein D6797_07480 [Bdellovibrio sp.]